MLLPAQETARCASVCVVVVATVFGGDLERESNFTRALASILALDFPTSLHVCGSNQIPVCFYSFPFSAGCSHRISFTSGGRGLRAGAAIGARRPQESHHRHTGGTEASARCCKLQVLSGAELHVTKWPVHCGKELPSRAQQLGEAANPGGKVVCEVVEFFPFFFFFSFKNLL